jgi:hypothetical protein
VPCVCYTLLSPTKTTHLHPPPFTPSLVGTGGVCVCSMVISSIYFFFFSFTLLLRARCPFVPRCSLHSSQCHFMLPFVKVGSPSSSSSLWSLGYHNHFVESHSEQSIILSSGPFGLGLFSEQCHVGLPLVLLSRWRFRSLLL